LITWWVYNVMLSWVLHLSCLRDLSIFFCKSRNFLAMLSDLICAACILLSVSVTVLLCR
jgi:hypothetical protein